MTNTDGLSDLHEEIKVLEKWVNQSLGEKKAIFKDFDVQKALLHKDLKCKAPLIEPNLRRNLGKWST